MYGAANFLFFSVFASSSIAFSAALPTRVFDLDPDDGYLPEEALCLVCNLTHYARLSTCPECKDLR